MNKRFLSQPETAGQLTARLYSNQIVCQNLSRKLHGALVYRYKVARLH